MQRSSMRQSTFQSSLNALSVVNFTLIPAQILKMMWFFHSDIFLKNVTLESGRLHYYTHIRLLHCLNTRKDYEIVEHTHKAQPLASLLSSLCWRILSRCFVWRVARCYENVTTKSRSILWVLFLNFYLDFYLNFYLNFYLYFYYTSFQNSLYMHFYTFKVTQFTESYGL